MSLIGSVRVDRVGDSLWVLELRGEHDLSTVDWVRAELATILAQGTAVVIDLSAASFIDSSIVSELIQAQQRVDQNENEQLAIVAPRDGFPARVIDLTNADRAFSTFETRADAVASFRAAAGGTLAAGGGTSSAR